MKRTDTVKATTQIQERLALMLLSISNGLAEIFHLSTISNLLGCPNKFRAFTNLFKGNLKSPVRYRLILHKGEVFRFPECRELHVLSGIAWITVKGEDIILTSQEKASFLSNKDAIISALDKVPLILEVL